MLIRLRKILPTARLRKLARRFGFARSGTVAVEFAIIAPVLISMTFGIIEFSRAAFTQGVLLYAVEEATRFAIVNFDATESEIKQVAQDKFIMIDPQKLTSFSVTAPIDPDDQTRLITVSLTYRFDFLFPFAGPLTLTSSSKGFITEES